MDDEVYWLLELAIQPGKRDEFHQLMLDMVDVTQANEPGTLNYEWSISADGKVCHIYERYQDSAAVLIQLSTFGTHFADRFFALLTPTRFVIYGSPSLQVKEALDGFGPVYLAPIGGFHR